MKLSNQVISKLVKYVIGDNYDPYRSASQILELFNEYGNYDYMPSKGFPLKANDYLKYSRRSFTEEKITEMNGTKGLTLMLEHVLNQSKSPNTIREMSDILSIDGYKIAQNKDGQYIITNGVIDKSVPVVNEAHFEQNEKTIIEALDKAKVSINVAMAWFTNDKIKDKLIEMKNAGVDVDLIIYDDTTNKKHGVDLSELPHLFVKGSRGGIMHNKFCVIDNQIVIQGSYNWTNKAEAKNDETIAILKDPKTATDFSVKFREIKKNSKKQLN